MGINNIETLISEIREKEKELRKLDEKRCELKKEILEFKRQVKEEATGFKRGQLVECDGEIGILTFYENDSSTWYWYKNKLNGEPSKNMESLLFKEFKAVVK